MPGSLRKQKRVLKFSGEKKENKSKLMKIKNRLKKILEIIKIK